MKDPLDSMSFARMNSILAGEEITIGELKAIARAAITKRADGRIWMVARYRKDDSESDVVSRLAGEVESLEADAEDHADELEEKDERIAELEAELKELEEKDPISATDSDTVTL